MTDISPLERFRSRLHQEWLEPFCVARGMGLDGFVWSSLDKLVPEDARDFMHALDSGLVNHHHGTFQTPLSKAKEQIFWEGARDSVPRKLTLWLEPIIAALRALGQVDGGLALQGGHVDLAAERGGGHAHRHLAVQVVAFAFEDDVLAQPDLDVPVAGGAAVLSRFAVAAGEGRKEPISPVIQRGGSGFEQPSGFFLTYPGGQQVNAFAQVRGHVPFRGVALR